MGSNVTNSRDELCPRGWRKADPGNFSLTISDFRKINIVVESGDKYVRSTKADPSTKGFKGLYMEAATLRNNLEMDMFPETVEEELRRVAAILEFPTYIFLVNITHDQYRGELSRPREMDGNQIIGWDERIFIPDADEPFGAREPLPIEQDVIDVPVRRKA